MWKNKKLTPSRKKTLKKNAQRLNKRNYDRKHPKESPIKATTIQVPPLEQDQIISPVEVLPSNTDANVESKVD